MLGLEDGLIVTHVKIPGTKTHITYIYHVLCQVYKDQL
jgi:hypothetical protein